MPGPAQHLRDFKGIRLDSANKVVLRDGKPLALPPKVVDLLILLLENPGQLLTKEDLLARLWPGTFVEESTLAWHISQLRKALGDTVDEPKFIATVPKRGYRFVAPVRQVETALPNGAPNGHPDRLATLEVPPAAMPAPSLAPTTLPAVGTVAPRRPRLLAPALGGGIFFVVVLGVLIFLNVRAAHAPRIMGFAQLTRSGRVEPWGRVVTDGARLYFLERHASRWKLMQMPAAGGEPQPVSWSLPGDNSRILDVSPNGSEFLAATFTEREENMPLWIVPAVGGSPVRLGTITARDAAWFPDGNRIVFAHDEDLFEVGRDGNQPRKLASAPGLPEWFAWSPDGRRLRFSILDRVAYRFSIWEVASDGTRLHPVLPADPSQPANAFGRWTPDGKYFVYISFRDGQWNVWALPEPSRFWPADAPKPLQLTAGPNDFSGIVFSRDAKRLYVPLTDPKTELVRYEPATRQFSKWLPENRMTELTFSRDSRWALYTQSDGTLWRSHPDGTERLQLTSPPFHPSAPRFSPDGQQVAFADLRQGGTTRIYIVSVNGGAPRPVLGDHMALPEWSPDAKKLACSSLVPIPPARDVGIYISSADGTAPELLPGSEGLHASRWSPDGRYLVALTEPIDHRRKLMLYDFRQKKWTEIASARYPTYPEWSHDGQYLYFQDILQQEEPIFRIHLATGKIEPVVRFGPVLGSEVLRAGFLALGPGDSPIVLVQRNLADLYDLRLDLP
jgi:DNA-binding winged helix-turn-helix (wHTH) protein/Tol biopolymer transport system component